MQIILLLSGIVVGFLIGWLFSKSKTSALEERSSQQFQQINQLTQSLNEERNKVIALNAANATLEAETKNLLDKKKELEELQIRFNKEFENLANKILDEKSAKFTEQNKTNLDIILNPLKEKIKSFEEKVDTTYKNESAERISLRTEIKLLAEQNKQIGEEANNLAKAMKGDKKKQGDWGENILQLVLEKAGLMRDVNYHVQSIFND
jgi:DNA recombination protein RmuC